MNKTAIYPGTFDPITNGHLDIIERSSELFDNVLVAIATSEVKQPMFTLEKRLEFVEASIKKFDNVKVITFDTLLVSLMKERNCRYVIRGLRAVSDFEYELQLNFANRSLLDGFESIYLMPSLEQSFVSSSIVRSILSHDGDASHLLPKEMWQLMKDV